MEQIILEVMVELEDLEVVVLHHNQEITLVDQVLLIKELMVLVEHTAVLITQVAVAVVLMQGEPLQAVAQLELEELEVQQQLQGHQSLEQVAAVAAVSLVEVAQVEQEAVELDNQGHLLEEVVLQILDQVAEDQEDLTVAEPEEVQVEMEQ